MTNESPIDNFMYWGRLYTVKATINPDSFQMLDVDNNVLMEFNSGVISLPVSGIELGRYQKNDNGHWVAAIDPDFRYIGPSYNSIQEVVFNLAKLMLEKSIIKTPQVVSAREVEFLEKLAGLMEEYKAEIYYNTDDDGVRIDVEGKEVFHGWMYGITALEKGYNATDSLRTAIERHKEDIANPCVAEIILSDRHPSLEHGQSQKIKITKLKEQ